MSYDNGVDELFEDGPKGPAGFPKMTMNQVIGGLIVKVERSEQRNIDGTTAYYDEETKKNPKPALITWVSTDLRDPDNPDDDGVRRIWWTGNALYELKNFQKANGYGAPKPGGQIWKKLVGTKPSGKGLPMNLYAAKYEPPTLDGERRAFEIAAKYNKPARDDMFGPVSTPPAQQAQGRTTLDSMRGGFTDEPPF